MEIKCLRLPQLQFGLEQLLVTADMCHILSLAIMSWCGDCAYSFFLDKCGSVVETNCKDDRHEHVASNFSTLALG